MVWDFRPVNEQIRISRLYSLFRIHHSGTYAFAGESHDFWECMYVESGSVCVSADERVYNMSAGDIIFHKPLELHKFYVTSEGGADIFVFSFTADGVLTEFFRNKVFSLSENQNGIIGRLIGYIDDTLISLGIKPTDPSEFSSAYYVPFREIPTYWQTIVSHIYLLMLSLADDSNISRTSNSPESVIFRNAVRLMNENLAQNLSVAEIAKQVNVSVSGLKRIFDRFSGIGVHKYYLLLRLKAATELLKSGKTVSETAEILGFSSQAYFSKTYKREMQTSPSAAK